MKNTIVLAVLALFAVSSTIAQNAKCGFDRNLERMLAEDPSRWQVIEDLKAQAQDIGRNGSDNERGGGPRIIPTVFHVIHQGGNENISYEQIEDQIRILNEDYRRMNEDTANTRSIFKPVAADCNVEFRLAKLDPQGNCTNGVVRVWSPLTYNASDDNGVKGVSYWPSNKYFNVWVVASIADDGSGQGIILGYAQFPGFGSAQTDGVVVRADYVGSIGTAANTGSVGRTLTHEAGHWLSLFHTFQGGCNSFFDDQCDDTPPQAEATPSNCPLNANTCSNDNPDLPNQVENYMDYSNGSCQNMFTMNQKSRMDATLSSSRSNIWSGSNLTATGVLLGETPCAPVAQFYAAQRIVCAGENVTFTDDSYNGDVTSYDWQLTGATPSSSTSANPTVSYASPGVYSVSLSVSNPQGSDSYTQTDYIQVIPAQAQVQNWFSFEGFESAAEDYIVVSDNLGNTWEKSDAAHTDNKSIYLNNFSGNPLGSVDEFMLPSVNMTLINNPDLYFQLSYKQRSNSASDNLRVYVSRDCGETWQLRYNKSGSALATVSGTTGGSFTPSSEADWEQINVNLGSFTNEEHLLVKFRGTSDAGNNIYIDDIQISGPLGVSDRQQGFQFTIGPNPMLDETTVTLEVANTGAYSISLMDVTGKLVTRLHDGSLAFGTHRFAVQRGMVPASGVYLLEVQGTAGKAVKKLIVQ
ncbi:MAG: PKD domain-containing protein [Flavobacteriales bacterium]|nr:PKD domain-containing protein [Flavobacteriales bacterium]